MDPKKIIVVVGPTATGKSDLAVQLAQKYNGEVISADSRQVYKGLNIGTGKITEEEMKGIPHHLLDIVSPEKIYTVSDYKKDAGKAIEDILSRGKMPIICGGTGFYIDAVLYDIDFPSVPPNKKLREELEKKTIEELQDELKKLDTKRFDSVDKENPRRLIRAIEIAQTMGKVPEIKNEPVYDAKIIGLDFPDEILKKRIYDRLIARIENGMIEEVEKLYKDGLSWERMEELGLEYRYVSRYLRKKITKDEMIAELSKQIWHYAKRQRTWFKRNKNIVWQK